MTDRAAGTGAIVVTRDEGEDGRLTGLLEARGLPVLHWPTVRIAPPADPEHLDRAVASLAEFDWIVFTSRRAVAAVSERLAVRGEPPPRPEEGPRVAAVGDATADALADAGWTVDLVPDLQTGRALLEALVESGAGGGARVLFPASAIARDTLPDGLTEAGAVLVQVEAYRTEPAPLDREACGRALESGDARLLTFTSPSAVRGLVVGLGRDLTERARRLPAVAIGPTTAEACERAGFATDVAEPHSLEGLADRVAVMAARPGIEEE